MPTNSPSMRSGALRQIVGIQTQSTTQDSFGQPQSVWTTVFTTHASIQTLTLAERNNASGFVSEASHLIVLRYQSETPIIAGMRITCGSHTYLVQSVDNVQLRNRVINCLALEITPTQ